MGTQLASAPAWTWAVPLLVAFVALFGVAITVLLQWRNFAKQLRSAHALKIAEMRQEWINNLRDTMAAFQSFGVTPDLDHRATREFYEHGTRIELMMNPNDQDYVDLQGCLYKFLAAKSQQEKFAANQAYVDVCQSILKREWEVLKKGIADAS